MEVKTWHVTEVNIFTEVKTCHVMFICLFIRLSLLDTKLAAVMTLSPLVEEASGPQVSWIQAMRELDCFPVTLCVAVGTRVFILGSSGIVPRNRSRASLNSS